MGGLTDKAWGAPSSGGEAVERAHQAWQESMLRQMDLLRLEVQAAQPHSLAQRCGGTFAIGEIHLAYWGRQVAIQWPSLRIYEKASETECSIFDAAMLLYYLRCADGVPLAERWIGYRELPGGAFYANAFQGYSGNRLAQALGEQPEAYAAASRSLDGWALSGLPGLAYAFQPLPRLRLAAILYPGDEEFPARASVLFDAAASHYMTTDGLALVGSGLTGRLIKAAATADRSRPSPADSPR